MCACWCRVRMLDHRVTVLLRSRNSGAQRHVTGTGRSTRRGTPRCLTPSDCSPADVRGVRPTGGRRHPLAFISVLLAVAVAASVLSCAKPGYKTVSLFTASTVPKVVADPDTKPVILATRIRASVAGDIGVLKFYRSKSNVGTHIGYVWDANGRLLASAKFPETTTVGWKHVVLSKPVRIAAGQTFVVGYLAPKGRYAADTKVFTGGAHRHQGADHRRRQRLLLHGKLPDTDLAGCELLRGRRLHVQGRIDLHHDARRPGRPRPRPSDHHARHDDHDRGTTRHRRRPRPPRRPPTRTSARSSTCHASPGRAVRPTGRSSPTPRPPAGTRAPSSRSGIWWDVRGPTTAPQIHGTRTTGSTSTRHGNGDQDACLLAQVGGMYWVGEPGSEPRPCGRDRVARHVPGRRGRRAVQRAAGKAVAELTFGTRPRDGDRASRSSTTSRRWSGRDVDDGLVR